MFTIYKQVIVRGLPNFFGAHIMLPTNLDIDQWKMLVDTAEDMQTTDFLQYGFYQGLETLTLLSK